MNKKILLIDDSKTQLSTLKILFKRVGFDVETAMDGIDGYQKIFEFTPDIIVSDIMMPNLNGYQFCRLVKDNPLTKDIPIVLLTILEQKIDKFWSKKSGADMFLLKSSEIQSIINVVSNLIEQKPVSNEIKEKIRKYPYTKGAIQEELNQILDGALMQASVLNEFRLLASHLDDDNVMAKNLFDLLLSVLNFDLALLIINPSENTEKDVYVGNCTNIDKDLLKKAVDRTIYTVFDQDTDYSIKTIYENWAENKTNENIFENSYIHPIKYFDNVVGAICFFGSKGKEIETQKFFYTLLKEIELLITIQVLYSQNKILSLTDSLTGLYNRRYLMENLEREYDRSKRYNSELSVAMIDIDYFKKINDTYGHQAGDYILIEITKIIKRFMRKNDIIFRYGGEEVLAIMPETDKEKAMMPLERVRKFIEEREFKFKDNVIRTSVSIGVTDTKLEADTLELFIEHADKAMYQAKTLGRNRIELYNE